MFTISDVEIHGIKSVSISDLPEVEVAIVLGGDGTTLRAAEVAHVREIPLLGVNLGHVGFLSEVEESKISDVIAAVVNKSYVIDSRITLKYEVVRNGKTVDSGWALNEVTVEREKATMVELFLEIDNRPISRWGCDGLICSTPTGSTAYAFSAGGPILWPEVDALVVLPISAHALFSRPLVISPTSKIVVGIESAEAFLSADALRKFPLIEKDKVLVTKNAGIIRLAHLKNTSFSDRLVAKFKLPVEGWRGE
jgi:NAD+ kinase